MTAQAELFDPPPKTKRKLQTAKVLDYMRLHGSIDRFDAHKDLNIERLAARIFELSKRHGISRRKCNGVARYSLTEGAT